LCLSNCCSQMMQTIKSGLQKWVSSQNWPFVSDIDIVIDQQSKRTSIFPGIDL
jgi:hypothetical protein